MLPLHVFDLTLVLGGEGDCGGVTGEKAAKPATAVQECTPI